MLDAVKESAGCASLLRQLRPAIDPGASRVTLSNYVNALHIDHVVMETAHRPLEELATFHDLRAEIGFGLGVIDIISTEIESADAIPRAVEQAGAAVDPARVKYVHPDCGFWMLNATSSMAKFALLSPDAIYSKMAAACARDDAPPSTEVRRQGRSNGRAC